MKGALARALALACAAAALGACSCGREGEGRERGARAEAERGAEDDGELVYGLTPSEASRVVARIDERPLTLGDVAAELASESGPNRARHMLPAHRHEVLEVMLRRILLADEARRLGLHESDRVRRARRTQLAQMLGAAWREDPTVVVPPSEAEIAASYEAHRDEFQTPRRRRCRYLVSTDRDALAEGLSRLIADPGSSRLYRELSEALPVDPPRYGAAGETGDFTEDPADPAAQGLPPELRRLAFEIEVSAWIDRPVEGEQGFVIAQVIAETPATTIPLENARDAILAILAREAVARAARRLVEERGEELVIDEEALESVRFPTM